MTNQEEVLDTLVITQERLTSFLRQPYRPWLPPEPANYRAALLHGPRGIGKTNLLLRLAKARGYRYLSADHPALFGTTIHEWVSILFRRGVPGIFIDEIHAAPQWSGNLKSLYDEWPDKVIWASGSNSLLLYQGLGDLSRRFLGVSMPFLSFREYLVLRDYPDFGVQTDLEASLDWAGKVLGSCPVLALFEEYLKTGLRPFFTEGIGLYPERSLQVIQKTLLFDVPAVTDAYNQNHFRLMNAVLGYLARSPIPRIHVNSLCREWNLGKEKLYNLLFAMEQTGVIRIIRLASDNAAMSVGAKIFLADPTHYQALAGKTGTLREAFAACALGSSGRTINASKDEEVADFIIDGSTSIEVGGWKKNRKRADLVVRDGADWPAPGIVPLWYLGFLW
jgi:predicted AAA+ superfamily ATPase